MSHVFLFFVCFFLQIGEASQWRVCYQRGLPRLVFYIELPVTETTGSTIFTLGTSKQRHCILQICIFAEGPNIGVILNFDLFAKLI